VKATGASRVTLAAAAVWVFGLVAGAPTAQADQADDLIRQIVREAKTRPEAAKKLLAAAGMLNDAPPVQIRICEEAYKCGITGPAGYASALAALAMLDKAAPDRADVWSARRTEVHRLQYLRGDRLGRMVAGRTYIDALLVQAGQAKKKSNWADAVMHYRQAHQVARALHLPQAGAIFQSIRTAENHIMVRNRLKALAAALEKDPNDLTSRERLVRTYLIDLDMPTEAAKLINDKLDAALRANVSLAAKEAAALADADFLTLGQWYRSLAGQTAIKPTKARLLVRAENYLRMYLEVHTKKDVDRLRATTALKAVQDELGRLGVGPSLGEAQWIDLLALADPSQYTVAGEWSRKGSQLQVVCRREGLMGLPITAVGSYDFQATFTLVRGTEAVVAMPVGAGQCAAIFGGYYGTKVALSMIDGATHRDNATTVNAPSRGRWLAEGAKATLDIAVRIKGDQAQITATLNGKKLIDWTGRQVSLAWHDTRAVPFKTFGLGSWGSTVVWHTAKLRMLDPADRTLRWVSKDATYKPSSVYRSCPPQAMFLTGRGKLNRYGASVITERQSNPHVTVTLRQTEMIKRIILDHRRGPYKKRNTPLMIAISTDGRRWTTVWRAKAVRQSYLIDFKLPLRARYVKVSPTVTDRTYLTLAGIRIYAPGR